MTDLPGYASGVYCWECLSTNHTANQCPYQESEDEEDAPKSLAATYSDNDLRYALDKASTKTSVAVLPLSSGLAKTHHLNALRLVFDSLPKEHWEEVRLISQLKSGDVYLVVGLGWECVSQLSNDPRVVDSVVRHPRTGDTITFGDLLTKKTDTKLYRLEQN